MTITEQELREIERVVEDELSWVDSGQLYWLLSEGVPRLIREIRQSVNVGNELKSVSDSLLQLAQEIHKEVRGTRTPQEAGMELRE